MTVFPVALQRSLAEGSVQLSLHGGSFKGQDKLRSSPEPISRPPTHVPLIEIAADEIDRVAPDHLSAVTEIFLFGHGKALRKLPEVIWEVPGLVHVTCLESRLIGPLFRRGLPPGLRSLSLAGTGRFDAMGGPGSDALRILEVREGFLSFEPARFPALEGLALPMGLAREKADRSRMLGQILQVERLRYLELSPAHPQLEVEALPPSLKRLQLRRGGFADLHRFGHLGELEYLCLHHLRDLKTLSGIERLCNLRQVTIINSRNITEFTPLLDLPRLERVDLFVPDARNVAEALVAKGVHLPSWRP